MNELNKRMKDNYMMKGKAATKMRIAADPAVAATETLFKTALEAGPGASDGGPEMEEGETAGDGEVADGSGGEDAGDCEIAFLGGCDLVGDEAGD